ncbi:MAG TPA: histone deacetylase family protein [Alphaproteobacteria bacterium]|nr:deacetylase [Rhodospirillaceae bacterium]HRJ13005.1 histone deacetylase family protein [Alphaproteobacteria bacterium]
MPDVAYITSPLCLLHEADHPHPENPGRLAAIQAAVRAATLYSELEIHDAPAASLGDINRAHSAEYIALVQRAANSGKHVMLDPDTYFGPHSWDAALHAAGAGCLAVDLLMNGTAVRAFCAVRPPGHHALRDGANGFCTFNNVAVAARYAQAAHGLERVVILDFDVHHGNGTEDIFAGDENVLCISFYEDGLWPRGLGEVPPLGDNCMNLPMPRRCDPEIYHQLMRDKVMPAIAAHQPDLIIIAAGFDAHRDDPPGDKLHSDPPGVQLLTDADFSAMTRTLCEFADSHCHGRVIAMLEGGYTHAVLAQSVVVQLETLAA